MSTNAAIESDFEAERCKVCQVDCSTTQQKEIHLRLPLHNRRKNISTFLMKIAANPVQSTRSSEISRRYAILKENVLGADCIVEFVFPWCESGWWACSICYESGNNYDLLDQHLNSRRHLGMYLNELIGDSNSNALTCDASELLRMKDEIFANGETMLPPDVISLSISKGEAVSSLVISDRSPPYSTHESGHKNMVFISCQVCHESFLSIVKGPEQLQAWNVHSMSPAHRNALFISNIIGLCNPVEVVDETANGGEGSGPFGWKNYEFLLDGKQPPPGVQMKGPVCGINYLVTFNDQAYCGLCFCAVDGLEDHFSCESHIIRFVNKTKPKAGFIMSQCHESLRRTKLLSNLDRHGLSIDRSRKCGYPMPKEMKDRITKGPLPLPDLIQTVEPYDSKDQCIFCPMCITALRLDKNEDPIMVWHQHIETFEHHRMFAKRNEFYLDDKFFVPSQSSIEWELGQINETRGQWTEEDGKWIQNQFNVGLEFIVDNRDAEQYVCMQCAEVFHYSQKAQALHHLRSLDHLTKYLHIANRDLISKFERKERNMKKVLDLCMDLLQSAPQRLSQLSDARVYDPQLAVRMESWGQIQKRTVEMSQFFGDHRDILQVAYDLVDTVSDDQAEMEDVSLREALLATSIKIIDISESTLLCRCLKCQNVVVSQPNRLIDDIWNIHLSTEDHQQRLAAIASCQMAPNGFTDTPSTYTVKEFEQKDPSKKVTWQWNPTTKTHDFVLAIVGLQDIVERKSSDMDIETPDPTLCDFYCRLCALSFPRKIQSLESHVRSAAHIYQYVHKYHPMTLKKIEELPKNDNGRELRKTLAQLLKDVKPPSEHCMMVYDPYGERERRAIIAMQRAQEEERLREEEEERRIAEETRKKKDEERRKQREAEEKARARIQIEREKLEARDRERRAKFEAERNRHEQEARAYQAAKLAEERERLMALAFAKKREFEAAKAKESERMMAEQAKKGKERAILQARLDEERKKLEDIREKKRQMQLIEERRKLEQELEDVRRRKAEVEARRLEIENAHHAPSASVLPVPQPSLIIPPTPSLNLPLTQPNLMPMAAMNQNQFSVLPPTFNAGAPPPILGMPMGQPTGFNSVPNVNAPRPNQILSQQAIPWQTARPTLANIVIDPYLLDPAIITTKEQLLDFMDRQGTVPIPKEELPLIKRFNTYATSVQGLLGLQTMFEVVCLDDPKLESYYCSLCRHWTFAGDMITHMEGSGHRLAYLFKFRKQFHNAVMSESNVMVRNCMIEQFALQIWKREQPLPVISHRLRVILNKQVIQRLWPNYYLSFDQQWKYDPRAGSPIPISPTDTPLTNWTLPGKNPVAPVVTDVWEGMPIENQMDNGKYRDRRRERDRSRKSRSPSPKRKRNEMDVNERRKRSTSRERSRRSTSKNRGRSGSRSRKRSRSRDRRHRSRTKSRSPGRSLLSKPLISTNILGNTPIGGQMSWEESAAAFLAKIGDTKAASKVLDDSRSSRHHLEAQAAATRLPITFNQPTTLMMSEPEKSGKDLEVNENTQMRKMLGLIVTMQKEAESRGSLDNGMINQLYQEMGLKRNDGSEADALLAKLCNLLGGTGAQDPARNKPKIDLSVFGIEEPNKATTSKGFGVDSSIPTFGQNSQNLYGVRKDLRPQTTENPQPDMSIRTPGKDVSSGLPPHLQNLLSGLKGRLGQMKSSSGPSLPTKPLFGQQEERGDLLRPRLNQDSRLGIHGRDDHRSFARGNYPSAEYPPPTQNRPSLPKSQMPVPVHPGQAGRAVENGYDAVFPTTTRGAQRGQPNADVHRGDLLGGPMSNQGIPNTSQQDQGNALESNVGKPLASRILRKKMRREVRDKGYNPDSFMYYQSGPEPIPGKNLQLPMDYKPSAEDLEADTVNQAAQPRQSQQQPRGLIGQTKPPSLIDLDEDDWEGVVGSLDNLVNEPQMSKVQQGLPPAYSRPGSLMGQDFAPRPGSGRPVPGRNQLQDHRPWPQTNAPSRRKEQGPSYTGNPQGANPYARSQPLMSQLRGAPPPPPPTSGYSDSYPSNYPPRGYY